MHKESIRKYTLMAIAGVMMLGGSVTVGAGDGAAPSTPPASKPTSPEDVKRLKEDMQDSLTKIREQINSLNPSFIRRDKPLVIIAIDDCINKYKALLEAEANLEAEVNSNKNPKAEDNSSKNPKAEDNSSKDTKITYSRAGSFDYSEWQGGPMASYGDRWR